MNEFDEYIRQGEPDKREKMNGRKVCLMKATEQLPNNYRTSSCALVSHSAPGVVIKDVDGEHRIEASPHIYRELYQS
ncbi:MAG: hypothetical protein LBL78_05915, partial [Prevotellaceae bacterium]|nr:hypothetical protein [Prevotellaceae bacterium]